MAVTLSEGEVGQDEGITTLTSDKDAQISLPDTVSSPSLHRHNLHKVLTQSSHYHSILFSWQPGTHLAQKLTKLIFIGRSKNALYPITSLNHERLCLFRVNLRFAQARRK